MERYQQTKAGIEEIERPMRAIFNQSFEFIALLEPDGILIDINQTALDFGGLSSNDVLGLPLWEASWWQLTKANQVKIREMIAIAASGELAQNRIEILGTDNTVATLEFTIRPIKNQSGRIILLIFKGQDLGDRKLLTGEHSVTAKTENAHTQLPFDADIFHNIPFGLQIWHLAKPNNINSLQLLAANPVASELMGINLSEYVGKSITEFSPDQLILNQANIELYAKVALSGQGEVKQIDYCNQNTPYSFFNVRIFPLPNRCVGVAFDHIAHCQLTEQALQESEQRFQIMANNAPMMIWMSGLDKLCNFFNQNWLEFTGRTMEQELGNGWSQGVHPEDLQYCLATYITAFDNRQPFSMEFRLRRFDGEYRWILDNGTPRFTTDGNFVGYIGSCIDITHHKQTEQALQQRAEELSRSNQILAQTTTILQKRNQELDQFAYVASHDLKAPLRAIASLSEWLEEDLKEQLPPENQQQMRLLRGRVRRMESLINGLLEYSRIGRIQTPSSQVNVGVLIKEVIDSLQPPTTFNIEIAHKMPTLIAKRLPLQQVFANLISNAIQHHSRIDGMVNISVQERGKYYEFTIADDGPGISSEYHDKIFTIFQTLESRDRKENTGIGLAIVKKIVETEGGTITLESAVNQGSIFRFTWPKQPNE